MTLNDSAILIGKLNGYGESEVADKDTGTIFDAVWRTCMCVIPPDNPERMQLATVAAYMALGWSGVRITREMRKDRNKIYRWIKIVRETLYVFDDPEAAELYLNQTG